MDAPDIKNKLVSGDIKILALDADNTLYKIEGIKEIYENVANELDWSFSKEPADLYEEIRQLMKKKKITYIYITKQSWFLTLVLISYLTQGREINLAEIYSKANELYSKFRDLVGQKITLTSIGKALEKLSKRYKIIVVSEEEKTFLRFKLEAAGLINFIHDIISSSEIGYLKPHEKYYELLTQRSGASPTEILFVDDDIINVEMAKRFNINAATNLEFEEILKEIGYK